MEKAECSSGAHGKYFRERMEPGRALQPQGEHGAWREALGCLPAVLVCPGSSHLGEEGLTFYSTFLCWGPICDGSGSLELAQGRVAPLQLLAQGRRGRGPGAGLAVGLCAPADPSSSPCLHGTAHSCRHCCIGVCCN